MSERLFERRGVGGGVTGVGESDGEWDGELDGGWDGDWDGESDKGPDEGWDEGLDEGLDEGPDGERRSMGGGDCVQGESETSLRCPVCVRVVRAAERRMWAPGVRMSRSRARVVVRRTTPVSSPTRTSAAKSIVPSALGVSATDSTQTTTNVRLRSPRSGRSSFTLHPCMVVQYREVWS